MQCPNCGSNKTLVYNSRDKQNGHARWRRKVCSDCNSTWTTMEVNIGCDNVKLITYCDECYLHERCAVEKLLRSAGAKKPSCSEGKVKRNAEEV